MGILQDDAEHAVWTWSEGHKEASLVLKCTTCGKETEAIKAEVEEKTTDANCTEAGTTVYKATAEYEGMTYTAEEKVTGQWHQSHGQGECRFRPRRRFAPKRETRGRLLRKTRHRPACLRGTSNLHLSWHDSPQHGASSSRAHPSQGTV